MMKRILLIALTVAACFAAVLADQAAFITQKQAERAAEFLKLQKEIAHFCKPCDDFEPRHEEVEQVVAEHTGSEQYWQVRVNGEPVDLAYVYFKTKEGKWKNLAKEMDIKVKDVPKYLEDN